MTAKGLEDEGAFLAFSEFSARQEKGQNYCLFMGPDMVATVCVKKEPTPVVYQPLMPAGEYWWIYALSTRRSCAGKGYGAATVERAVAHLDAEGVGEVYLDCLTGNGFLPAFYGQLGFKLLGRIMADEGGEQLVELNLLGKKWRL